MSDNFPNHTDPSILRLVAEGDEPAFRQLFYAWKDRLFGFVANISKSDSLAEDIVQEVFLKVWNQREKLLHVSHFSGFLFEVAQNSAIDQLRKLSRESAFLSSIQMGQLQQWRETPEHNLTSKELKELLQQALDQLPARQKEVFILHQQEGFKHDEIAAQLGLSLSTVQNHMFRALENLRKQLAGRFPEGFVYLLLACATEKIFF